jgi:CubicO group peptidase (beta-lactamase class C family)
MLKFCIFLMAFGLLTATEKNGFAEDSPRWTVDEILKKYDEVQWLSGSLLIRKDRVERYYSFGNADDRRNEKNTRAHRFMLASVSKSFVSAAILKLRDQGKLNLDDPIAKFLPELPPSLTAYSGRDKKVVVTIKHLLSHTAGMPEAYYNAPVLEMKDRVPVDFKDFVSGLQKKYLYFEPGSQYEYCNTGYVLLGEIVGRAAGESYATYLKRELLGPLGLDSTTVGPPKDPTAKLAQSYLFDPMGRINYRTAAQLNWLGKDESMVDLNIYSSADDLLNWAEKITSGKILTDDSTRLMLSPVAHTERTEKMVSSIPSQYGLGWRL